jgi:hypothetical protein
MHEENRFAELFAQAIGGEVGLAARERAVMDHEPSGFVDDGEVVVAVENVQVHTLQPELLFVGAASAASFSRMGTFKQRARG